MRYRRFKSILLVVLVFGMIAPGVSAYSFTENDSTDYSTVNGVYSIWAFSLRTASYLTGEIEVYGQWDSASVHFAKLFVAMQFTPPSTGRVHCSADWNLNYHILAGVVSGGYAKIWVRYYLLSSSLNEIEFKKNILHDEVTCTDPGNYDESTDSVSEDGSNSVYWNWELQADTTYYAAVTIYIKLYYGGYAYGETGEIGDPQYINFDVNEINVWS